MKKILFLCFAIFAVIPLKSGVLANTVNINWLVDGETYAQTTCATGADLILPTAPTKYGYTFQGWHFDEIVGAVSQQGTPTPTNPVYPVFLQFGNTVLRAVGSGNNLIADSYDPTTGKITRRIGVKVLNGTESFTVNAYNSGASVFMTQITNSTPSLCSHFSYDSNKNWMSLQNNYFGMRGTARQVYFRDDRFTTGNDFKAWLSAQYDAGTPVTVYYPLDTPLEENVE